MLIIKIPAEYGGAGADVLSYSIVAEETARECLSTSSTLIVQSLVADCIYQFGTEAQKQKYLPKMGTAEFIGAFGLTEPGAGSDASGVATKAEDKGDYYLVNGTKIFITSANHAEFIIAIVRTDSSLPGTKGLTALIIDKDQFIVTRHEDKMGMSGSHSCEVVFKDAVVPKSQLLGKAGEGFKIAMTGLDGGRIAAASQCVGMLQAFLDESVAYAQGRVQFGKPIASFQAIQWMIADMAKDLLAGRELVRHAANLAQAGLPYTMEAAAAKLFCAEAGMRHAINAVQIQGGYGYCNPAKVERMFRDIKIVSIYEGTSEIQRLVIAGKVLG
jgi:alkylation response protein AidB-like acyl-CoA dehydrogenase